MAGKRYSDKQIEDALVLSRGMVYVAANALGCSPNTIKKRLSESPELQEAKDHAHEYQLDRAETKLAEAVDNGESWAIQFYLKTQGSKRGYAEKGDFRHTIAGDKENPIKHDHSISTTSEVIAGAIKALEGAEGGGDITGSDEDSE